MEDQQNQPYEQYKPKTNRFVFFAGVIMPAVSITIESTTHICAEMFFDPLPTLWHFLLVVFVPLAQLHVWFAIRKNDPARLRLAGFANACVIAISIFYSIVYAPLLPLALLALLFGIGILPLTPYLSLLAALIMRHQLNRMASGAPQKIFAMKTRGLLTGLAVTLCLVGLIELPRTLTRIGLQKAIAASAEERADGIRFLRSYGDKDTLLRTCYNRTGMATDLFGSAFSLESPITPEEAQKIYYRVTGETFDASIPPARVGGRVIPQDTVNFDSDQGGTTVGGKLKGLSLSRSNLEGNVDANGGVGYLEWTLVFNNESQEQREARAELQLPPGAVVSRVSLWVNGEPREAAFAGRNHARQAYQQVAVRQRRDPVLVTTAGRDRILVQCFPVPPDNGTMKIRIGMTVPLVLEDVTHARLLLPHFVSRNFATPDNKKHEIFIQSKTPIWPLNSSLITTRIDDAYSASGSIAEADLLRPGSSVRLDRDDLQEMWSEDPFDPGFLIKQTIEERRPIHLNRIVLVVDTSNGMSDVVWAIQSALKSLPAKFDVKLIFADSDGLSENSPKKFDAGGRDDVGVALDHARYGGGADNAPALLKAWETAAQAPGNNAIVWIHRPQPLLLHSVDELRQRWESRPYGPKLYSVQTTTGVDEIEKQLDGIDEVKSVARMDQLQTDLENLFARLTARPTLEFVRSTKPESEVAQLSDAFHTSDHLARLWANDEVVRILAPRDPSLQAQATTLAVRYQLVTPVSGAVVLENEAQYRAADLKPVDAGTVPTIPEPEMVVLLIVGGAFMIAILYFKYRKSGPGRCTV